MVYQTPEAVYSIQGYHPRALMRPKLCYRNDYYKLTIIEKGACIIFSRVLVPEQQILESSSKYVYPDPVVLRQLSPGLLLLALTELDIYIESTIYYIYYLYLLYRIYYIYYIYYIESI